MILLDYLMGGFIRTHGVHAWGYLYFPNDLLCDLLCDLL